MGYLASDVGGTIPNRPALLLGLIELRQPAKSGRRQCHCKWKAALTDDLQSEPVKVTATQARASRIVKGGAIRRILWVSLVLALLAMAAAYFVIRWA